MSVLEFRILGPLQVLADGRPATLGGLKPRQILATLLLTPNRVVSTEHLVEVLWPVNPPRSATANIRTYVSGLRATLGDRLRAQAPGYAISVADAELDLTRFTALTADARQLAEVQPQQALIVLCEALDLWRGDPLADLPQSPLWTSVLHPLAERRLTAWQDCLGLQLAVGDAADAIAKLRGLVARHPLREDAWAQLISALHAHGRRAEALDAYADLRSRLADELGVEPGPALHRLHLELLAEPVPVPAATVVPVPPDRPVCMLPADVPDFTGRVEHLAAIITQLTAERPAPVVVSGPPGIGKSALALRAAHAVRHLFPDGQLYLDLGRDGGVRQPDEQTAFRSRLADRRVLLLLDNATDATQVRGLLPPSGACAVLVTSRAKLTDLPGVRLTELDGLDRAEATEMLGRIAGAERITLEPIAAAAIVDACAGVPLAVRVAGARLAARRDWSLRVLADRLGDESRRLAELQIGALSVRESIDRSYRQLAPEAAEGYRRLAPLDPQPFPAWVLAAAMDRPHADTELDALVDANLVQPLPPGPAGTPQYRLPDLVRLHARTVSNGSTAGSAAVTRVVAGWLALVESATATLPAHVFAPSHRVAARWHQHREVPPRIVGDSLTWLDTYRPPIVAAVGSASGHGLDDLAWELAAALVPYLDLRGQLDAWESTHRVALAAVRRTGNRYGQASLLRGLGQLHLYRDAYRSAERAFTEAASRYTDLADERGEASALSGLGAVHRVCGDVEGALACYRRALDMFVQAGDEHGAAYAHGAIGMVWLSSGEYGPAREWLDRAYRLAESIRDGHRIAHVRQQLGALYLRLSEPDRARAELDLALAEFETIGDRHGIAYTLHSMGELAVRCGDTSLAAALLDRARGIVWERGDRLAEARVCRALGGVHRAAGQPALARTHLERARVLSRSLR